MVHCSALAAGWIRVGATLALLFGSYYLGAAWGEQSGIGLRGFYLSTVAGRFALSAVFCYLVLTGQVEPALLILAAANFAGAVSLALSLRADNAR